MKAKPIIAILCDEVRQEDNGKPFLIGIYPGGMTIPTPIEEGTAAIRPVCLWVPLQVTETGVTTLEFQLTGPSPEQRIGVKINMQVPKLPLPTEITAVTIPGLPITISQSGELKVLFKHEDESDWETLRIIPVTVEPKDSSSSVIAQPSQL
jgi:hypothetical protein